MNTTTINDTATDSVIEHMTSVIEDDNHRMVSETMGIEMTYQYSNEDILDDNGDKIGLNMKRLDHYEDRDDTPIADLTFNDLGHYHSFDGKPATTYWYRHKNIISSQAWYNSSMLHREGLPAVIAYDEQGNITEEAFYRNGRIVVMPDDWRDLDEDTRLFTWGIA